MENDQSCCIYRRFFKLIAENCIVPRLKTRLILVLGHTQCGAIAGAAKTFMESNNTGSPGPLSSGWLSSVRHHFSKPQKLNGNKNLKWVVDTKHKSIYLHHRIIHHISWTICQSNIIITIGPPGSALEGLLMDLTKVAGKASEELGPGVELDQLANHAVKVNVFHSMDFLLRYSRYAFDHLWSRSFRVVWIGKTSTSTKTSKRHGFLALFYHETLPSF